MQVFRIMYTLNAKLHIRADCLAERPIGRDPSAMSHITKYTPLFVRSCRRVRLGPRLQTVQSGQWSAARAERR